MPFAAGVALGTLPGVLPESCVQSFPFLPGSQKQVVPHIYVL